MLLLDQCVEHIRDFIVISFLLLERRRRETEAATINRAQSGAINGMFGAFLS
jgi:hypothetical protein